MLRINEAARRLGITPATLRRWEDDGLLIPDRTVGGERRYHEGELDQLAARIASGDLVRSPKSGPNRSTRLLNHAIEEDDEREQTPIPSAPAPIVAPPPPWERRVHEARADLEVKKIQGQKAELERTERQTDEARTREAQDAQRHAEEEDLRRQAQAREEARLANIRTQGELIVALSGAPTEYKAAVTRDLATYVTPQQFPPSLYSWQAYQYISARVDHVLKPWRDKKAKEQEAEKRRRAREDLLSAGRSYAGWKTSSWDPADALRARRDVDQALRDEVVPDWTRQEVIDLVEEVLEEWED